MTPISPSSSEGSSLPPRHRPTLGELVKETTEADLWSLEETEKENAADALASGLPAIPEPAQEKLTVNQLKSTPPVRTPSKRKREPEKIDKIKPKSPGGRPSGLTAKTSDDFEDLDHWGDIGDDELDLPPPPPEEAPITPPQKPPETVAEVSDEVRPVSESVRKRKETADATVPVLNQRRSLSLVERIGLGTLAAVLLVGAIGVIVFSLHRIPTESALAKTNSFPIQGKQLTIVAATSYWRSPVSEGKNADVVRRGTVLIPAVKLTSGAGSGALRLIFLNSENESVGDIVTRAVKTGESFEIAATAGFDDIGMHAAYRTGETKPWRIEAYEAPSVDSPKGAFAKIFEMSISTDRR